MRAWTTKEMMVVQRKYEDFPVEEIAREIDRPIRGVYWMARKLGIKKPRNIVNERMRIQSAIQIMAFLLNGKFSVHDLSEKMGIRNRTIYRHIDIIKSIGVEVRQQEDKFFISGNCPICLTTNYEIKLRQTA